ncbi:hypothetical protein ACO0SA_004832 [Hanseniaspora valbyensis]
MQSTKNLLKLPLNGSVGVVGSGISSLFFTYFLNLKRPDLKITLLEKNKHERVGGWIYTKYTNKKIKLEKGPRTLRGRNIGTSLIINSMIKMNPKVKDELVFVEGTSDANTKFLVDFKNPKELVEVPPTDMSLFFKFMKSGLSDGLIKSIFHDIFSSSKAKNCESVYDFMVRRFGDDRLVNNVISAVFFGIYATDVKELSMNYCLPKLVDLEKKHGSIIRGAFKKDETSAKDEIRTLEKFAKTLNIEDEYIKKIYKDLKDLPLIGFKKGMSTMPNTVANYLLQKPNIDIKYGYNVQKLHINKSDKNNFELPTIKINDDLTFDHVHLSTIPQDLKINHNDLTSYLESLGKGTNVLLINIFHPTKNFIKDSLKSFGFLVPKSNNSKLLGVIFDSVIETNFKPLYPFTNTETNVKKDFLANQDYTKMTMMVSCDGLNKSDISYEDYKETFVKKTLLNQLRIPESEVLEIMNDTNFLVEYTFANNSIPKYAPNIGFSSDKSKDIRTILEKDLLYNNNISVGGFKFASGPGMPDVVVQSFDAANRLN